MVGELISLPVRIGLRTASIAIRGSLRATEQAFAVATHVARVIAPHERDGTTAERPQATTPQPPARTRPDVGEPRRPEAEPEPTWEPTPVAPAHVSEEPELVETFAEPGAEDGAGAELRIDEPWRGYGKLTAKDVVARVAAANPEELAAVQLYEATHRKRETVLSEVERALRIATADRSGAADPTIKEQ